MLGRWQERSRRRHQVRLYDQNLLASYHIAYGGYGGIAYHHVSDTYVALFSHFIPCGVWEAVYIIDGLLKNTSDIQPDTVHADTQGQSLPGVRPFASAGHPADAGASATGANTSSSAPMRTFVTNTSMRFSGTLLTGI
ncbi:Tn3 family transposase [Xanthomonas campestris]|uniref:Tn3 family transposase n=1 Tax=Xanthomonas campestris TaxID=339 RepID=UPI002412FC57|nr:Tn3 family transposase [Xanthomonas campestris]